MKLFLSQHGMWILAVALAAGLSACKPQSEQPSPSVVPESPRAAFVVTEELQAKLAEADAADGAADHVVSKCITCRLSMDGKPAHAATVADYTVHLCSAGCKASFEKDPSRALLALSSK